MTVSTVKPVLYVLDTSGNLMTKIDTETGDNVSQL